MVGTQYRPYLETEDSTWCCPYLRTSRAKPAVNQSQCAKAKRAETARERKSVGRPRRMIRRAPSWWRPIVIENY